MEAVRQIHDDPESHPEEATVEAVRRMIVGESAAERARQEDQEEGEEEAMR